MRGLLHLIEQVVLSRRKVRRAEYAVALLRHEANAARRHAGDRNLAKYLNSLADIIERTP